MPTNTNVFISKPSTSIACDACRRRKIRCDRGHPCNRCLAQNINCLYTAIPQKRGPRAKRDSVIKQLRVRPEVTLSPQVPSSSKWLIKSQTPQSDYSGQGSLPLLPNETSIVWNSDIPSDWTKYPRIFLDELLFDYFTEVHPITPVLNSERVSSYLNHRPTPLTCCLVYGLCYLGAQATTQPLCEEYLVASQDLLIDAMKYHDINLFASNPCVETVMAAYILWVANYKSCRFQQSFIYIREAITLAQMMGLDREEHYIQLRDENLALQHRVLFHTLYTSERGAYMQFPQMFRLTIPSECLVPFPPDVDEDYTIVIGLARIHSVADDISKIIDSNASSRSQKMSPSHLMTLLHRLESSRSQLHSLPHELQKADFLISNLWFRVHVLRLSGDALYTLALQSDTLRSIQEDLGIIAKNLSTKSIEVHGTTVFLKLCDIMETLSSLYVAIDGSTIYDQSIVTSTVDTRAKIDHILKCIRKVTQLPLNPFYQEQQLKLAEELPQAKGTPDSLPSELLCMDQAAEDAILAFLDI